LKIKGRAAFGQRGLLLFMAREGVDPVARTGHSRAMSEEPETTATPAEIPAVTALPAEAPAITALPAEAPAGTALPAEAPAGTDTPPDRLCASPRSPHYDEAVLERGVGIIFEGVERTNVDEYCISEGWVKVAAGKSKDRYGNPLTIKLKGKVEPYFKS
jgi:hypothetical protein